MGRTERESGKDGQRCSEKDWEKEWSPEQLPRFVVAEPLRPSTRNLLRCDCASPRVGTRGCPGTYRDIPPKDGSGLPGRHWRVDHDTEVVGGTEFL